VPVLRRNNVPINSSHTLIPTYSTNYRTNAHSYHPSIYSVKEQIEMMHNSRDTFSGPGHMTT